MLKTSTPITRRLQGVLATTIRDHGPHSPEARDARQTFNAHRLAGLIAQAHAEHGPFEAEPRAVILAALEGEAR